MQTKCNIHSVYVLRPRMQCSASGAGMQCTVCVPRAGRNQCKFVFWSKTLPPHSRPGWNLFPEVIFQGFLPRESTILRPFQNRGILRDIFCKHSAKEGCDCIAIVPSSSEDERRDDRSSSSSSLHHQKIKGRGLYRERPVVEQWCPGAVP